MKYKNFKQSAKQAAQALNKLDKKEPIRIISHLDTDGITSAAILINALNKQNRKYSLTIVQQLTQEVIEQLSKESFKHIVFTDIGSGQFVLIKKKLKHKKVFIFDHHELESEREADNVVHVNPHLHGIDGSGEISGAGVVYFMAKEMDQSNKDLAHIAVIGALGDIQEHHGFKKLNNEILEQAIEQGKIKVINGLRVFGAQTKPLHKILEYSTHHYIPSVTGSESGAIAFLQELRINPKEGNKWKKLVDLEDKEIKKLATGLVIKRLDEKEPERIIGPVYILKDEKKGSPLRDAKEFSTLLNACGRLGKASLGIGVCLNDKDMKKRALRTLSKYKEELIKGLRWYESSEDVLRNDTYTIINAQEEIRSTMIGTISSIVARSNTESLFVLGMARIGNDATKVSLRITKKKEGVNLVDILKNITDKIGGQSGGHMNAAGALISSKTEQAFIKESKKAMEKYAIEEVVK